MATAPHKMVGLERCWIREVPLYTYTPQEHPIDRTSDTAGRQW